MGLLDLSTQQLVDVLKRHGITKDNISFKTCLYEAGDEIKAVINGSPLSPPDDSTGKMESVGFFYWMDTEEYWRIENSEGLSKAGDANLEALREML